MKRTGDFRVLRLYRRRNVKRDTHTPREALREKEGRLCSRRDRERVNRKAPYRETGAGEAPGLDATSTSPRSSSFSLPESPHRRLRLVGLLGSGPGEEIAEKIRKLGSSSFFFFPTQDPRPSGKEVYSEGLEGEGGMRGTESERIYVGSKCNLGLHGYS